jgi:hypothetical protein
MIQLLLMKISNWLMPEPKRKKRVIKFKKVIKKSKKFI